MSPVTERGSPGMQRKKGRHGDGVIVVTTIPKEHCPMGRRDKRPALADRATYPKGSDASDAVDAVLEFYGVDKGVIKDPAYCEPLGRRRCRAVPLQRELRGTRRHDAEAPRDA